MLPVEFPARSTAPAGISTARTIGLSDNGRTSPCTTEYSAFSVFYKSAGHDVHTRDANVSINIYTGLQS